MAEWHTDNPAVLAVPLNAQNVLLGRAPECQSEQPHFLFFLELSLIMPRLTARLGNIF